MVLCNHFPKLRYNKDEASDKKKSTTPFKLSTALLFKIL